MVIRVQVLATARDYAAARRVLERELEYFGGHRSGDARDQTRAAMRSMVARTRDKLQAFLRESGR